MVALKILDVKSFMSSLLIKNIFDHFLLSELEIQTYNQFKISGRLNKLWYTEEEFELLEQKQYSKWCDVKPIAFQLIKGNKTPLSFKMIFLLSPEHMEQLLTKEGSILTKNDINGFFLNIYFEKGVLSLTTGTSIKVFMLDKTIDHLWDNDLKQFLKHSEIIFEEFVSTQFK